MEENCQRCGKSAGLCVCEKIIECKTRTRVLILQHPQEPDKTLGTAQLLHAALPNSVLKAGLSWRNLSAALGEEAQPKEWAVLYLGSVKLPSAQPGLVYVDRDGKPLADITQKAIRLKGIVVLDGTWSQAKTLWWRNAWLLKLHRAVLNPEKPSRYGKLRKEPRAESVSTLESTAQALATLERDPSLIDRLEAPFADLLVKYKNLHPRGELRSQHRGQQGGFRVRRRGNVNRRVDKRTRGGE
jgi:DTW domain-containing protein YfiP